MNERIALLRQGYGLVIFKLSFVHQISLKKLIIGKHLLQSFR